MTLKSEIDTLANLYTIERFLFTQSITVLSVCPGLIIVFLYFHFYALTVVLLKGMVEICLLSKDELQTPNIEQAMVV